MNAVFWLWVLGVLAVTIWAEYSKHQCITNLMTHDPERWRLLGSPIGMGGVPSWKLLLQVLMGRHRGWNVSGQTFAACGRYRTATSVQLALVLLIPLALALKLVGN